MSLEKKIAEISCAMCGNMREEFICKKYPTEDDCVKALAKLFQAEKEKAVEEALVAVRLELNEIKGDDTEEDAFAAHYNFAVDDLNYKISKQLKKLGEHNIKLESKIVELKADLAEKDKKIEYKNCFACNDLFIVQRPDTNFCSDTCRKRTGRFFLNVLV